MGHSRSQVIEGGRFSSLPAERSSYGCLDLLWVASPNLNSASAERMMVVPAQHHYLIGLLDYSLDVVVLFMVYYYYVVVMSRDLFTDIVHTEVLGICKCIQLNLIPKSIPQ